MLIRLHTPGRKLLFGVLCLGLIAGYGYRAGRSYMVSRMVESSDPEVLERAVRLEPTDADAWYRLGRVRSILMQDIPGSIPALQRAIALDPRHGRYWLDLGLAYQYTGDSKAQRNAIETAVRLDAHDPDIAWEAGNFYLIAGDTDPALKLFRVAVEGDPSWKHFSRAVLLSVRATHNDYERVLNEVVPRNPRLYLDYTNFLVSGGQYEAADLAWSRTIELGMHVKPEFAKVYLKSLVQRNDSQRARNAWNNLAKVDPELQPYTYSENLIVNGGFENNILNFGFDWEYGRKEDVGLEIDNELFHGGNHALLMTFSGQPVADIGLRQTVPVDGSECYELSGYLRTSELEGVSGPRIALREVKTLRSYALSDNITGTHGWDEVRKTFRTDPGTHFLELAIVRERPETAIRGRAWADDLRLTRVAQEACR
jgi:tetratricopeptide (TPR) repeat protein